ncbi:MAG TPA: cysteine desulfurase NifS [Clostridiales bacterium]|nr:cysteine desulfurase NifS [Clostridiales bacterium]
MNYKYFDNAATTRVDDDVAAIVNKYNQQDFFNPSANYRYSVEEHNRIGEARETILRLLKGQNGTIYFTSSGTEADNQAVFCSKKRKNSNIVISSVEHPAVYNAANALKNMGYDLRICPVDGVGRVDQTAFASLIDKNTFFVSVMHVNNETGAVNDIAKLVKTAKSINPSVVFHSDGVQAFGKVPVNLAELNVDLYTISGHKIGAPKGIAALYVKKGVSISPLLYGGGQENGVRSSTENVSGIMAFAFAATRAVKELSENTQKYLSFIDLLRSELAKVPEIKYISDEKCSPHIFTFAFKTVRGEVMQHALEESDFLVGTGSACSARRSHDRIPAALGLKEYSDGVVRVSFGRENKKEEVDVLASELLKNYEILKKYVGK